MPPTGSTFTDWQQVERESRLFIEGDFDWSEPPQRRRRRISGEPIRARRRATTREYESELLDGFGSRLLDDRELDADFEPVIDRVPAEHLPVGDDEAWGRSAATHSHFDEMMAEWDAAHGSGADRGLGTAEERAFDLSDPGAQPAGAGARRTVVITGHGDERYLPAPRRRRSSELRFHERSGFSPDRMGLWAVLLGIALVIGAVAH